MNIRGLLGVGLDGSAHDVRVTRGEKFYLFGGCKATHERMVETALRFNDKVDDLGKRLEHVNSRELDQITRELGKELR